MVNNVSNFILLRLALFFVELVVLEILFLLNAKRKKLFVVRLISSLAVSFGVLFLMSIGTYQIYKAYNFVNNVYYWVNTLSSIIIFSMSCAFCVICFDISIRELFSVVIFSYAGKSIAFCIYSLIFTNVNPELLLLRIGQFNLLNVSLYLLTYLILYVGFYFCFMKRFVKNKILSIDTHVLIIFIVIILINTTVGSIAEATSTYLEDMLIYNMILISESLTLTLMLVLNVYNQKSNELKIKNETSKLMLENQEKQYKFAKANAELLHIKAHDLKHQVAALREGGEAAEKVLNELSDVIQNYESVIITENKILNVILSEKWMYCTKHNIKFSCTVDPNALVNIEPATLYSLIGNILDNCIEAVMKFKNKDKRVISMNIKHEYGMSIINTKNYYDGEIIIKNGFPESTKQDKNKHGYGVRSIKMIIDNLGGSIGYNIADNTFILQASIPD